MDGCEFFGLIQNAFGELDYVTLFKIFDEAAGDANQVMMIVFFVGKFVIDVAVAQVDLSNEAGFEEGLDNSIDGNLISDSSRDSRYNFLSTDRMLRSF